MKKKGISEVTRSLLILLFAYTAFSKLLALRQFEVVLRQAPLIGSHADLVAWLLPSGELLLVALLLIPKTQSAGLKASLLTLIGFTIYLIYMLIGSSDLPCQCGGVISAMGWKGHIVFNLAFIGLTAYSLHFQPSGKMPSYTVIDTA